MTIRLTLVGTDWSDGQTLYAADLNDTIKAGSIPIGGITPWLKTFASADSGTTTSTSANHLVQTGQNFMTTVAVGYLVHNTTDSTFAYVTAVNSDTDLTLDADIMTTTEAYTIYKTPQLNGTWVECNGQVLSDAASLYNGATIPNLNAGTYKMLRGALTSGATGGGVHNHQWYSYSGGAGTSITFGATAQTGFSYDSAGNAQAVAFNLTEFTDKIESLPYYYSVVFIMRVK